VASVAISIAVSTVAVRAVGSPPADVPAAA
jgi:hypothetical protein